MRIAYIVELDGYRSSGVLTKITSQIKTWNNLGVEAKLFLISKPPGQNEVYAPAINEEYSWVHSNYFIQLISNLIEKKQNYLNKILTTLTIKKELKKFKPDLIYYRFGIWFPGQLYRFGTIPVVVELNTNDKDEFKLYGSLTKAIHFSTRKWLLKRASGFCSVTEEINNTMTLKATPSMVIGNGVDIRNCQQKTIPDNQRVQLVFVGSSNCTWHGVDKIIPLARLLHQYDFHIVGLEKNVFFSIPENIFFYGFLEKEELSRLYQKMDIAIGTLALHRKKMEEASPLKVREYVSNGLPVIVGYFDTDLKNKPFLLNIGNYEENVVDNIDQIVRFVDSWKNKTINVDLSCIDMYQKERQRIGFFSRFIKNTHDV